MEPMTFEQWWREHGKDYWGAPYNAAKDAWEAALAPKMRTVSQHPPDLLIAVEYGYKQCEAGLNLQQALAAAARLILGV